MGMARSTRRRPKTLGRDSDDDEEVNPSPLVQRRRAQYKSTGPSTIPRAASATFTPARRFPPSASAMSSGSWSPLSTSSPPVAALATVIILLPAATYPVSPHFPFYIRFLHSLALCCIPVTGVLRSASGTGLALVSSLSLGITSSFRDGQNPVKCRNSWNITAHLILALRAQNWIFRAPFSSTQNDSTTPSGVFIEGVACDWFRKSFGRGVPSPRSSLTSQRTAHAYSRASRSNASNFGSLLGR
jgi:hypothetical protein